MRSNRGRGRRLPRRRGSSGEPLADGPAPGETPSPSTGGPRSRVDPDDSAGRHEGATAGWRPRFGSGSPRGRMTAAAGFVAWATAVARRAVRAAHRSGHPTRTRPRLRPDPTEPTDPTAPDDRPPHRPRVRPRRRRPAAAGAGRGATGPRRPRDAGPAARQPRPDDPGRAAERHRPLQLPLHLLHGPGPPVHAEDDAALAGGVRPALPGARPARGGEAADHRRGADALPRARRTARRRGGPRLPRRGDDHERLDDDPAPGRPLAGARPAPPDPQPRQPPRRSCGRSASRRTPASGR